LQPGLKDAFTGNVKVFSADEGEHEKNTLQKNSIADEINGFDCPDGVLSACFLTAMDAL
jgi:hypothetical protein